MRKPTRTQQALLRHLDEGHEIEDIASNLGKSVLAVKQQIARIRRRVQAGHIEPSPLPIEKAAREPRVYLAGFDVFRADAVEHGNALKALCREYGFRGEYPLDGNVPSSLSPNEKAAWIFRANIELIRTADMIMANLNDFRGPGEPDSGTAFEVGFAAALGKPIWAYRGSAVTLVEHVPSRLDAAVGLPFCMSGYVVEDFGLTVNLMLACAAQIVTGGPAECLQAMKAAYAHA